MDRKPMQQFQYCSFCKTSHKQKKNHVYSKRHQQIISRILHKFSEKVKLAKSIIESPDIQDVGFEYGAKFWCYFCVDDFRKHLLLDVCTSKFGGLLEHISKDTHRTSVFKFLQDHRIDADKFQASAFLLSQDSLKKFKPALEIAVRRYEEKKNCSIKQGSELIKREENRRRLILHTVLSEPQPKKQQTATVTSIQQKTLPHGQRKTTLTAHGDGLTFIGTRNLHEDEGNIHTEAPPPWLQDKEEDNPTRSEIGPTIEDFNKHLEEEKRKKLPPGRVGAKFDHSSSVSSQWLPSFGRVWNTGRRQQSEIFFRKEMSQSKASGNSLHKYKLDEEQMGEKKSSMSASVASSIIIKPYVKKKRRAEDNGYNMSTSIQNTHNVYDSGQNIHSVYDSGQNTHSVYDSGQNIHSVYDSGQNTHSVYDSSQNIHSVYDSGQNQYNNSQNSKSVYNFNPNFPQDFLPGNSNVMGSTRTHTVNHNQQSISWNTIHTNQQGGTNTGNIFEHQLKETPP